MTENKAKIVKNHCDECKKETKHLVLSEHQTNPFDDYAYSVEYQIVECCGCSYVSFRKVDTDFEAGWYDEEGLYHSDVSVFQYPIPLKNHQSLDWEDMVELPNAVWSIYNDTLKSYANGSKILVGAGLRACIEAVCNDLNIAGKDLEVKIKKLNQSGYISKGNTSLLNGIRFIGNDSIHEMKKPTDDEIKVSLRVVEHLFENVYILPKIANGTLKTTVEDYTDFLNVLKQNLQNFSSGDEFGLCKLLGKDFRRCQSEIGNFQQQLDSDIDLGVFTLLKKGKVDTYGGKPVQHYILT